MYDSDDAGVRAALRAIPILREAGITSRVVSLKPHKDPDEFIKALGGEEFEKRLERAMGQLYVSDSYGSEGVRNGGTPGTEPFL